MAGQRSRRRIPEATVARLPVYLRILTEQFELGAHNMSSEELAELAGVNAAKVRKDLSYLGSYGTRGVGYDVEFLVYQIRRELGLTQDWPVIIVGAGHLGQALEPLATPRLDQGADEQEIRQLPRRLSLPHLPAEGSHVGVLVHPARSAPAGHQESQDQREVLDLVLRDLGQHLRPGLGRFVPDT